MANESSRPPVTDASLHPEYALSPITISVVNRKTESREFAYLYITTDRVKDEPWGHLEIAIGAVEPFTVLNTSILRITFPPDLLSREDLAQVRLETDAEILWSLTLTGDNEITLQLKPGQPVPVTPGDPVKIGLRNVLASQGQALHRFVTFEWAGFKDVRDNYRDFIIERVYVPASEQEAKLSCSWVARGEYGEQGDTVYPTPWDMEGGRVGLANRVVLRIVNSSGPLRSAGARIVVSFWTELLGDARRALCTAEQLKGVICSPYEQSDPAWAIDPVTEGKAKYWVLTPPATGEMFPPDSMVSFEFINLVTQMPKGGSPVLVQWSGIKDRSPGFEVKPLTKTEEPKPCVASLEATVDGQPVKHLEKVFYKDKILLTWKLFAADGCYFADGPTRYLPTGTREVIISADPTTYSLTPYIALEKSEKSGEARAVTLGLRNSIATIEADRADPFTDKAKLTWLTRGGDTYLSGPDYPRQLVSNTGTLETAGGKSTWNVECVGLMTAKDSCRIRFPCPVFSPTLEWLEGNSKGRFSWTSQYSIVIMGYPSVLHPPGPQCGGHEGTFDFPSGEVLAFPGDAIGSNRRISFSYVFPLPGKVLPPISFQEEEDPKGPDRLVTWDMRGYAATAIGRFPGTMDGRDSWMSPAKQGTQRLATTSKWRFYMVMAALEGDSPGGVMMIVTPFNRGVSSVADVKNPFNRPAPFNPASLDLASYITDFIQSASLPGATGDSLGAVLLEFFSAEDRSSS